MTDDPAPSQVHPLASLGPVPALERGPGLDRLQLAGAGALLLALVAAVGGWWGVSGTADPAEQLPYLASAGLAVGVFVAAGITLLVASEHARDRIVLERVLARVSQIEDRLEGSEESLAAAAVVLEELQERARSSVAVEAAANGRASRRRAPAGSSKS